MCVNSINNIEQHTFPLPVLCHSTMALEIIVEKPLIRQMSVNLGMQSVYHLLGTLLCFLVKEVMLFSKRRKAQ